MLHSKYCLAFLIVLFPVLLLAQRSIYTFNKGWHFRLGDDSTASHSNFTDDNWRLLNLPHDWSIEAAFSPAYAATTQGGALPGGVGWYRKNFTIKPADRNKKTFIEFDGVYQHSEVWINGKLAGRRPNGYISFRYDISSLLNKDGAANVVAVRVDNSRQPNSRWYTGSGIYRDVRLVFVNDIHIDASSLFISTPRVDSKKAEIHVTAKIEGAGLNANNKVAIEIRTCEGKQVYRSVEAVLNGGIEKSFSIANPELWDTENPNLYELKLTLLSAANQAWDETSTCFGIRSIAFDREKGFFLNGRSTKIKGVCLHHDLGLLGAAFNASAAQRQLTILKEMGCNAIRTAHNPPAPQFLDLCDQMGFLVMDEAFDMWQKKKNKFDYALDFAEWHRRDLQDMIIRDRNHPSVFMWSIGNEIREQFDSSGTRLTKELTELVKALDTSRPVTSALTELDTSKNFIYQAKALDVTGWNYNHEKYPQFLQNYPGQIFIASETNSAIASRGHYDMPADSLRIWPAKGEKFAENINGDWTVSAYDNAIAYWGGTHEDTWRTIKKYDFLSGLFVWTGFDYLGEPTPYPWPARSSYFGIVDLAGFPKDIYYMYQSEWTDKPVLHLFPHWNWEPGKLVDVRAYYNNADEVELYLNGKSLGSRKKTGDELHVQWQVKFEPGILKAVSRKNGLTVLEKEIKTAGAPAALVLESKRMRIKADGNDLAFIECKVVDAEGNLVPNADNLLSFSLAGTAKIAGTDNGYQADTTALINPVRKAWKGRALAVVRSSEKKGNNTLTVSSPGLKPASIQIKLY